MKPTNSATDSSSNLRKHTNPNPVQQWLIRRFHQAVLDLLDATQGRALLEVGCGEGFATQTLLRSLRVPDVTGLDVSLPALSWARRMAPAARFLNGDASSLPFPDGSFDVVVCLEVLEHLVEPKAAMSELCRVARSDLLLSVPNEPWFQLSNLARLKNVPRFGNDPGHVQHWSTQRFVSFIGEWCEVREHRSPWPWTVVLATLR